MEHQRALLDGLGFLNGQTPFKMTEILSENHIRNMLHPVDPSLFYPLFDKPIAMLVYILHHVRADDEYGDDAKLIGVYRSRDSAEAAVARLQSQPGFRDHPAGFQIDPYQLDKDHWSEGFIKSLEA